MLRHNIINKFIKNNYKNNFNFSYFYNKNHNIKWYEIFLNYKKINLNNIKAIHKKTFHKISSKNIFIVLDSRSLKTKFIAFNRKKCLFSMTNGIIFKKLTLRNKKYKKSEKLSFLNLKNSLVKLSFLKTYGNIFIYVKGVKNNINGFIKYLIKKINNNNVLIINSYKMSKNKFFGFKKIKSIKRKLKKKFIKLK